MSDLKPNEEPFFDPLHKFTIEDWNKADEAINISDIMATAAITEPITLETMMAAIETLQQPFIFPEGHPLYEVLEVKELAALKGCDIILISGETAYYHPDMFELNEVKVLRLPKLPEPELNFKWDFTTTENLKF